MKTKETMKNTKDISIQDRYEQLKQRQAELKKELEKSKTKRK